MCSLCTANTQTRSTWGMEEKGLCHLGIFLHCQRNSSGATVIVFADSLRQGNYTKNWANKLWKIHSRNCVFINMGKTGTCIFSKTENESKASTNREDQLFPELLLLDKAPWKGGSDWYLGGVKWKYIPRVQKKKRETEGTSAETTLQSHGPPCKKCMMETSSTLHSLQCS